MISEVAKLLPKSHEKILPEIVQIEFVYLEHQDLERLSPVQCDSTSEASSETQNRHQGYGYFNSRNGRIRINRLLLWDVKNPTEPDRFYPCGHGSMYRLALATLIHELSHVYDETNLRQTGEAEAIDSCAGDSSKHCRRLKKRPKTHDSFDKSRIQKNCPVG